MSCPSVRSPGDKRKRKRQSKVSSTPPPSAANKTTEVDPAGDHVTRAGLEVRCIYAFYYERFLANVQFRRVSWPAHPRWDGGRFRGNVYRPIWPDIAEYITALNLPYFEFIRHKFSLCSRTPPRPEALLSDIGAGELLETISNTRYEISIRLHNDQQRHMARCRGALRELCLDPSAGALSETICETRSKLFMYAAAVRANNHRYAHIYHRRAFEQYLESPCAYQKAWGDLLPETVHFDALTCLGVRFPTFFRPNAGSVLPASESENHADT